MYLCVGVRCALSAQRRAEITPVPHPSTRRGENTESSVSAEMVIAAWKKNAKTDEAGLYSSLGAEQPRIPDALRIARPRNKT